MTSAADPRQAALPGLEPAPLAPILPPPGTRPAQVLAALVATEHIDQRDALAVGLGWRLAAHVAVLRSLGWPILTDYLPAAADDGSVVNIAVYRLDREGLARIGCNA